MFLAYFVFVFFGFLLLLFFFSFILFYFINSLFKGKRRRMYRILQKGVLIKYLKLVKKMVWRGVLQETFCRRGGFDV